MGRLIASLTFLGLSLLGTLTFITAQTFASGTVSGRGADGQGHIVEGIITFKNARIQRKVPLDSNAQYQVVLPLGVYKVSADLPQGWLHFERASIRVRAGRTLLINIDPIPGPPIIDSIVLPGHKLKPARKESDTPVCQRLWLRNAGQSETNDIVVQYGSRKVHRSFIDFKYATLTHNFLRVDAQKIRYFPRTSRFETFGGLVILDDGEKRRQVKSVEGNLMLTNPITHIRDYE
jgi:hypothetical protein